MLVATLTHLAGALDITLLFAVKIAETLINLVGV
jgi:hypothetical protein